MKFEDLNLENVQNIEEGVVFKNRRELCEYLGVEYKATGKQSKLQAKKVDLIFSHHREGHKIIVDKVNSMANIELSFKLVPFKDYPNFKVAKEDWFKKGIYGIYNNEHIYIGSTIDGFRPRYQGHLNGNLPYTLDMLENQGGKFVVLQIVEDDMSEEDLVELEESFVQAYVEDSKNTNTIVLNRIFNHTFKRKVNRNTDCISITTEKLSSEQRELIEDFLIEAKNGLLSSIDIKDITINKKSILEEA